ncbi:hypothetical protein [Streptomyces lavendofoliae]|uniref:Uncharacterized protein n=1 Tax=Streptomyces lavendofoliae TaxID=67314 RepID=A0A918M503_9ACTN|nr:hypothetical protein [Streptomyces lavendofoliae]GGU42296.1 hypothetical protein GCM10010274_32800 [Streptomyces lavendofoliae]
METLTGGTALALAGVLLGTLGTLIGQHLATRVESRRHQWERAATERAERKAAIMDFLGSAQRIELVLDRRTLGPAEPCGADEEALHELWLAKKSVELVCGHETAQAAQDYAEALHIRVRNGAADAPRSAKRERRHAFMEAARGELGSGGTRLKRRGATR